ncbi:MAG TPA: NAD(P)/FAD-dependent oxidoreductase [Baekduia sp.]|uniref:NAD(P)/FAD-dependent oxidoreductase n=1 Tax=Baekduia sp. TaxID=2600305 RepID=UPI002D795270|nr:NAD(P)/FAD-dependent oxidoreductase [Baekduia sp.]HET6509439.1 NAD(P)/FAD-dependent oxidoreductase [Baekduia sp.]
MPDRSEVVIAGGSIAGCTLAALLGRQGIGVTVLEKSPKPEHYKVTCTHFVQAGGTPVFERLGIAETMEAAGAVRNGLELWTEDSGFFVMPDEAYGYSIRREKLDPMLRELAARTPNVTVRQGVTVTGVARDATGRPSGLRGRTTDGETVAIDADVVVGADGRGSTLARLADVPGRVLPHGRIGYMAYYRDLELTGASPTHAQMWLGADTYYCFPNDDGLTVAAAFVRRERLATFKADPEAALRAAFARLPGAPDFARATRVSPMIGKLDMPNVVRPAARPGVAFVGDAAQASDPLWGVGCGFALMSAQWLADELAGPLTAGTDPDPALERYRRQHRRMLRGHHMMMCDFSTGRDFNVFERTLYRAAVRDGRTAGLMAEVAARSRPLDRTFTPRRFARAMAMGATR